MAATTEKAMRPRRTALGGQFSIRLKAAPVLSTCERRKTPGMMGIVAGRMRWTIQFLDRRSSEDDERGDEKRDPVRASRRLRSGIRCGHYAGS